MLSLRWIEAVVLAATGLGRALLRRGAVAKDLVEAAVACAARLHYGKRLRHASSRVATPMFRLFVYAHALSVAFIEHLS